MPSSNRSSLVGFDFFGFRDKLQVPRRKYWNSYAPRARSTPRFWKALRRPFLGEQVEYPEGMEPRTKSRFEMMIAPQEHEMHHRGQLMVVQRMLGITPHLARHMEERIAAMQSVQTADNRPVEVSIHDEVTFRLVRRRLADDDVSPAAAFLFAHLGVARSTSVKRRLPLQFVNKVFEKDHVACVLLG
jgi:hypothetical protein